MGRSNVGKSSLINALVKRNVARTSAAPGKTRLANFYRVQRGSAPALYLVDLPGLWICPGRRRVRRRIQPTDGGVLFTAQQQDVAVLLLVDARHPGLASDLDAWDWLKSQPCARGVVATKVDKLTRAERTRHGQ